ncbi:M81 family metallopeptidase [Paenibacillus cymbidii]|uniref:M81 family metallopeptidase n=1 Tax=Paenibacillus cymbidii TaxID=1639034 RepID=UPI00108067C0|nr:M81 family metallopeptidase [Paenibacillus cymbidii]
MKVLIGQIAHETNTFAGGPTTEDMFKLYEWDIGEQLLERHRGNRTGTGGLIDGALQAGFTIVPTFGGFACPSGIIARDAYDSMKQLLLAGIRQADLFDAVCLSLHGAGVAEGIEDVEGDIIRSVRELVGDAVPIVVILDLHANMTEQMVGAADIILGDNYYPHIDSYERGLEAIDLLKRSLSGSIKPVMHLVTLPLMIPTSATHLHPVNEINERCWSCEQRKNVLDCTFYHGFPYADIEAAGASVLVITNDDARLAATIAREVADEVMERKEQFFKPYPDPAEGVRLALQSPARPVVINETADNPGGGAPGDGTHLLRALVEARTEEAVCFGFIYDPEVALAAHRSGVGNMIEIDLGAKTDTLHGTPLHASAYVKTLSDGKFVTSSPMGKGTQNTLGLSVRLQIEGVDVIVCSVRSQVFDEQIFLLHGIDITQYKLVALKSSHHFRASFEPVCEEIITVDSPGLNSMNFQAFVYERIQRPKYPFDALG